jgi:drug/metabolite transporter (DMT)-like permease
VAEFSLLILTLLWGTTFALVKEALEGTSPAVFLTLRFGVAVIAVGAVALVRREKPTEKLFRHAGLLGLFMAAGFLLQTFGLRLTTPARSGFFTGLTVIAVPFLLLLLVGRRPRASAWAGAGLAVAGLLLLTRPFSDGISAGTRLGDALTIACAAAFALDVIYTSEWSARHPLVLLTLIQMAVMEAAALAALPFEERALRLDARLVAVVLFTGVAMTAGAFFVMNWAQLRTSAVRAALIYALEPVAAALFSHYYGGEPLGAEDWIGGGLIVVGVVVGQAGEAAAGATTPAASGERRR